MFRKEYNKREVKEKPLSARIVFGAPGHEKEYVLSLENCDTYNPIPRRIELEIKKELGEDWDVSNRGTRIEILNKNEYGGRDDERVHGTVKKILISCGYILEE